ANVHGAMFVAGEEIWIAGSIRLQIVIQPYPTAADRWTEMIERLRLGEPEIRLRFTGSCEGVFQFSFVKKLALGGVITAKNQMLVPPAEIADHFEIRGAWLDACGFARTEV